VEELLQFAIMAGVALIWLLGSVKKAGQRRRPPPVRRPQPQRPAQARPSEARPQGGPAWRQEGLEAILDLLRGELPPLPEPEPVPDVPQAATEIDDEARPLNEASHRAFHEQYVEGDLTPAPVRRSRYRLTPKTAREAVVWTAIFSPPKGYE
jgi:hypothetical protein